MRRVALTLLAGLLWSTSADAQLSGFNFRGDWGIASGTQPDPHLYLVPVYSRYSTNSVRDSDGEARPNVSATIDLDVVAAFVWWVTDLEILGANYGIQLSMPWVGSALEAPGLGVGVDNDLGFGDLYVQPINLGWHRDRADFMVGAGVYVPTGRWNLGADDNRGLGMWGFDVTAGSTVYLNRARSLSVSALAAWETHTKKEDTDIKVGDLLTLEGGLGASFLEGGLNVGAAYFFQWKLTGDDLGIEVLPRLDKARSYGIGPEATVAIPLGGKLRGIVTARYLWDYGVRSTAEGETFVAMLTVPLPSITLDGGS
ncbi:MAG TPA: transporter [Longimicrobiales bacterium]|nr:transporter [Longimicrobiales bacterium]